MRLHCNNRTWAPRGAVRSGLEAAEKITVAAHPTEATICIGPVSLPTAAAARRARAVARPRQVAMYLAKQLTSRSLPEIGRKFGGRDHTTVMHAVKKVDELREHDSTFAEDVELLRRMLEG